MNQMELTILNFIQEHMRNAFLDVVMPFVSTLGNAGFIWIALTIVLLISKKHRKTGILMALALVFDVILCNGILKNAIARTRPFDVNTAISLLVKKPTDYSFPSGHTAASFAAVTALFFAKEKYRYQALVLAVLIAFSRLYLYVHYPTDILGGILVGILCGVIAYLITRKKLKFGSMNGQKENGGLVIT